MQYPSDDLIAVRDLPRHIPGRPHHSTIWRWMTRGIRGIRLISICVGGRRFVKRAAIDDFIAQINARDPLTATPLGFGRNLEIDRAERALDRVVIPLGRQRRSGRSTTDTENFDD